MNDNWHLSLGDSKNRLSFTTNGATYFGSVNGYNFQSSTNTNILTIGNDGAITTTGTINSGVIITTGTINSGSITTTGITNSGLINGMNLINNTEDITFKINTSKAFYFVTRSSANTDVAPMVMANTQVILNCGLNMYNYDINARVITLSSYIVIKNKLFLCIQAMAVGG